MMKNYLYLTVPAVLLILNGIFTFSNNQTSSDNVFYTIEKNTIISTINKDSLSDFLHKGYRIFDTVYGDLNNDQLKDCILIIKGTNKKYFVKNRFDSIVDRNRRGIIILFNKGNHYVVAAENDDCFSSENEDGGVYMPPELWIEVKKGNLCIHYGHGRYGYWEYTFHFRHSCFELIGYDSDKNHGPTTLKETSINFLTKKKLERININPNSNDDEKFREKWSNITVDKPVKLTDIKDFDTLDIRTLFKVRS